MLACISRRPAGRSYVTRGRTRRTSARGSSSPITGQEQGRRALAARDFAPGGSVSAAFGLRPVPGGEVLHARQAASRVPGVPVAAARGSEQQPHRPLGPPGGTISRLRILPVGPFGRASTIHTVRGYLYGAGLPSDAAAVVAVRRAGGAGARSLRSSISPRRRASRSHAVSRVVRRNMNRRHMPGDHHGRMAGRATLLVRAVDEILGTHRIQPRAWRPGCNAGLLLSITALDTDSARLWTYTQLYELCRAPTIKVR